MPAEVKSFAIDADDLVIDDADDVQHFTPPPEDDDPFWSPEDIVETAPAMQSVDTETFDDLTPTLDLSEPPAPLAEPDSEADMALPELELSGGKNDYLANARKAAQAQSTAAKPAKAKQAKPAKQANPAAAPAKLRGPSRVVLWTATRRHRAAAGRGRVVRQSGRCAHQRATSRARARARHAASRRRYRSVRGPH